ncbi:MAG TPA: hypothetical protein VMJ32_09575 [Pirellulales bacterium]|nr:hypothetical protein [Pirellulales bacterium]
MQSLLIALVALGTSGQGAEKAAPKAEIAASVAHPAEAAAANPSAMSATATPAGTVRLMSAEKEQRLRKLLPRVDDPSLQKILKDPRLILYTEQEMPRAYQEWSGSLQGIHSAYYNISANGSEPYGNGNREFPWGSPAGTQRTSGVEAFRFVWLPRDSNDRPRPVVWFRKRLRGDTTDGYAWTFPVGAVVGEALTMTGPDGYAYTFELRTRTRQYGSWDVDVFRPFPTAADLAQRIKALRPDWQNQPKLAAAIDHLEQPLEMKVLLLADKQPAMHVFRQTAGVDSLPPLSDDKLVGQLLSGTVFRSVSGEVWQQSPSGVKTYAPTTAAGFNIVPTNYEAGFVQVDSASCMRCHESAARPVSDFNPGRDWYGHIRGSDAILSFHPFAPESVSDNGYGRPVKMRAEFEQAGVIAKYDPQQHPAKFYQTLDVQQQ